MKWPGSTTTIYVFSGSKVIAEYSGTSSPYPLAREYIYSGGGLLATIAGATTTYHHSDHLSVRVTTDSSGNKIGEQGHYPYGESWYATNTTTKWQFTSYERDSESGNDYAMMRSSVNRLGRFSSPDLLAGSTSDPQSLNHYTYGLNDPVNLIDPFGLDTTQTCLEDIDGNVVACSVTDSVEVTANVDTYWALGGPSSGPDSPVGVPLIFMGGGKGSHGGKFVNQKVLAKCVKDLFGVITTQFTESAQGTNGSFTGQGPDTLSNGGNDTSIHVTNDIQTYSGEGLKALRDSRGNPPLPQGTTAVAGLTLWDQPYVNYTANNLSQLNQPASMAAETQVHELGNSLHYITGAAFNPATVPGSDKDAGQAVENCVRNRGGFNKP